METIQDPTITIARKQHKCNFCNEVIQIKEHYYDAVYKEGAIYHWKSHRHCSHLVNELKMGHNGNGITSEDFEEYITVKYHIIMAETQAELYEGPGYTIPEFRDQLLFVANHYSLLSL